MFPSTASVVADMLKAACLISCTASCIVLNRMHILEPVADLVTASEAGPRRLCMAANIWTYSLTQLEQLVLGHTIMEPG